jgi:gamma-glutamyltranspeptidase / glutathione hydrolase
MMACLSVAHQPVRFARGPDALFAGEGAATAFPLATDAALAMLRAGGNAIDAAVSAAWALSVCEPSASGLGGQTLMMLHLADGGMRVIDGHSRAPAAASVETITKAQQETGYRSCVVPSTPATLEYALERYGSLDRRAVMSPAIRIARNGYAITPLQSRQTGWVAEQLRGNPAGEIFLCDGQAPPVGHILRQPALAGTLERISDLGAADFYEGGIAHEIVRDMKRNGGLIGAADLARLALPVETEPLSMEYRGHRVHTVAPPGGGPTLLGALHVLDQLGEAALTGDEESWYERIALATFTALRAREAAVPVSGRSSLGLSPWNPGPRRIPVVAAAGRGAIVPLPFRAVSDGEEPGDTTHLVVADRFGNLVSLTQSIQSVFGAKVASRGLGFVYNNYLCTCPRTTHSYALAPGCRPRSNATPVLVFRRDGPRLRPFLALGAAGSRRIISAVLQVMSRTLDRGEDLAVAMSAPRVHALASGKLWIERPAATPTLLARLGARFAQVRIRSTLSSAMGAVHALQFGADGTLRAAADPRRGGQGKVV